MNFKKIWPVRIWKTLSTNWLGLLLVVGGGLLLMAAGQPSSVATAQSPMASALQATPPARPAPLTRPFQLPFADPPSLATWMVGQTYGNTSGSYRQRFTTYGASGGIHFGLDLSTPCGTEILAIADGVVFAIDGPFGSPPHNLMIDHPDLGYASLYGHLLEAPDLVPGQRVQQGEVVARSGSSRGQCPDGQHLHLEIRDLNHVRKYNPLLLIEANWDSLALVGSSGVNFMRNLDAPRQWQSLYDQPEVFTGGPIVNDFRRPWPFAWDENAAADRSALASPLLETVLVPILDPKATLAPGQPSSLRQQTSGGCCTNFEWSADSAEIRFLDQPSAAVPLGIWAVKAAGADDKASLVTNRLGFYNRDQTYITYPQQGLTIIERLADGQRWSLDTQGQRVSFTPNGRLMWTVSDSDSPGQSRRTEIWLANLDGSNVRRVAILQRGSVVAWLDADTMLISTRVPRTEDIILSKLSLTDGRQIELLPLSSARDLTLSPDGGYLVYQSRFNVQAEKNGLWLIDLSAPVLKPEALPFLGSYRWRNEGHLVYIPFDPETNSHVFYEYDLQSGQSARLFPPETSDFNLTITNADWKISPDGRQIALLAAQGMGLDGIWVIDLAQTD